MFKVNLPDLFAAPFLVCVRLVEKLYPIADWIDARISGAYVVSRRMLWSEEDDDSEDKQRKTRARELGVEPTTLDALQCALEDPWVRDAIERAAEWLNGHVWSHRLDSESPVTNLFTERSPCAVVAHDLVSKLSSGRYAHCAALSSSLRIRL